MGPRFLSCIEDSTMVFDITGYPNGTLPECQQGLLKVIIHVTVRLSNLQKQIPYKFISSNDVPEFWPNYYLTVSLLLHLLFHDHCIHRVGLSSSSNWRSWRFARQNRQYCHWRCLHLHLQRRYLAAQNLSTQSQRLRRLIALPVTTYRWSITDYFSLMS